MSFSYLLGNLVGRVIISLLLVWLAWLCASRFNPRTAWTRTKRPSSLVVVAVLTLLGLGSALVSAGGIR